MESTDDYPRKYSSDESDDNCSEKSDTDDNQNEFLEQGSMGARLGILSENVPQKRIEVPKNVQRKTTLMMLTDHRSLSDYDATEGPEPSTYGQATNEATEAKKKECRRIGFFCYDNVADREDKSSIIFLRRLRSRERLERSPPLKSCQRKKNEAAFANDF